MPAKLLATPVGGGYIPAVAVTGDVTYRQRITVPAGARVEVTLADMSRADAPALVLKIAETVRRSDASNPPMTTGRSGKASLTLLA